jgi:3-methyladenine DNA glycosylase/8-oxoguanine DNA glycosylase
MTITLPTPPDFSFRETVHAHGWRHLLPFAWNETTQTLERIEQIEDNRVVLLTLRAPSEGTLTITSSEDADEAELTRRARRMLQLDIALDGFHKFCAADPKLAHLPARKQGRLLRSPTLWEDAVKVILTTNTTWAQTRAMTARLCEHFGSPWPPDPARHAFPAPAQIAAARFDEFAALAKLGYRNASVHGLATAIADGTLDLEAWQTQDLTATEWRTRLLGLRGIGPYGAACLLLYLGRPEHVNADSWARMLLSKELGRPVTDKEVHAFFNDYGDWRGLVYNFYPWRQE